MSRANYVAPECRSRCVFWEGRQWPAELAVLRGILPDAGLTEERK